MRSPRRNFATDGVMWTLVINPHVREVFMQRARMVKAIRDFLDGKGFIEVETPCSSTGLWRSVCTAVQDAP